MLLSHTLIAMTSQQTLKVFCDIFHRRLAFLFFYVNFPVLLLIIFLQCCWHCWFGDRKSIQPTKNLSRAIQRNVPGLHHYECVAPLAANSLQSGRFWAKLTASVHDSPWESRSFCIIFIQVIRSRPGGLFQYTEGNEVKICFASTLSSIQVIWPRAGSGVVRMDPLRFLAGCRTRRLNQA